MVDPVRIDTVHPCALPTQDFNAEVLLQQENSSFKDSLVSLHANTRGFFSKIKDAIFWVFNRVVSFFTSTLFCIPAEVKEVKMTMLQKRQIEKEDFTALYCFFTDERGKDQSPDQVNFKAKWTEKWDGLSDSMQEKIIKEDLRTRIQWKIDKQGVRIDCFQDEVEKYYINDKERERSRLYIRDLVLENYEHIGRFDPTEEVPKILNRIISKIRTE